MKYAVVFLLCSSGCALVSGLSDVKTCKTDPCTSVDIDGGDASNVVDAAIDNSTCPLTCVTVPQGWQPITIGSSCAPGLTPAMYNYVPIPISTTCTCNCVQTVNPTCAMFGSVQGTYGDTAQCSSGITSWSLAGCQMVSGVTSKYASVSAAPASGGACAVDNKPKVPPVPPPLAACVPPPSCLGLVCATPNAVCIASKGAQTCPTDFPITHHVGSSSNVSCTCPQKNCTIDNTCKTTLRFYSDKQCATQVDSVTADGTCNFISGIAQGYQAYKLEASNTNVGCNASTSANGTAKVDVIDEQTICCKM